MPNESLPQLEEKVIEFWEKNRIFERSVEIRPESHSYVFYDGPPFATGLPHYGHLLGSTLKDVIPRYFTMKGFRVERVWGWDCHGLPIENMIEKELGIKGGKKGIEKLGIDKFCQACRTSVLRLDEEWKKFIHRIGRFVDMENSYKTMDNSYIESVWWGFKKLWQKGLIYEGRRVILYCSRCATPLSDFEIAMDKSYQEVKDDSLYVKFKIRTPNSEPRKPNEYLLAWTTTPWTLPGNVALAVDEKADYIKVKLKTSSLAKALGDEVLILAEKRLAVIKEPCEIVGRCRGKDLLGLEYEPLYPFLPLGDKKAFYVTSADFVSLEEGTGIVHTAAIYGEDDYELAVKIGLPTVPMLDEEGKFLPSVSLLAGKFFPEAGVVIIGDLKKRNLIYRQEKIVHSYPFCYRCETPLFYNAVPAWFINIQKIKKDLLQQNEKINWYPGHFKHGQFKDVIENSPDWNISRSRYWGSPMPIWLCQKCRQKKIIGSVDELVENALEDQKPKIKDQNFDLHRPYIDEIKLKCQCGGLMRRISEVFDCWVESASMPFAAKHYPFENKKWFEQNYPADFIGEYSGQVRAWFNVLHRLSVALFGQPSFKNVAVTGVYLGTDGKKMSKSKGNFPDPLFVADKYGVDALRFYMMGSNVMKAEDVIFSEREVEQARNQVINLFYNSHKFLRLYFSEKFRPEWPSALGVLNRWLIRRTEDLVRQTTKFLDDYNTVEACRLLRDYVSDLSTWYLRRSRNSIKNKDQESARTLATSLIKFSQLAAPLIPFVTEIVYQDLTGEESVHFSNWPTALAGRQDAKAAKAMLSEMELARKICELGHAARKKKAVRVRQPLPLVKVVSRQARLSHELAQLVLQELNVKSLEWQTKRGERELRLELDTTVSPELKAEGEARELIRRIQDLRKAMGCSVTARIKVFAPSWPKEYETYIKRETLATKLQTADKMTIEVL